MINFNKNYILITTLLISLGIFLCSCRRDEPPPRPNIILIVADTLRADHLGCYGYQKNTTPNLDRFAGDCLIFDNAYAQIPSTLPSHISLFAGMYPDVHKILVDGVKLSHGKYTTLDPQISTLTEKIKEAGYTTIGMVSSIWLKKIFGFGRGFDSYRRIKNLFTPSDKINAKVFQCLTWMSEEPDQKYFLFLHYYEPHSDFYLEGINELPYYSPPPYSKRFCRDPQKSLAYQAEADAYATCYLRNLDRKKIQIEPPILESIVSLYDGGIAYLDNQLGKLFWKLKESGFYDDALIIFTSDHGEEFREHGQFIHNQPYQENTRVPLLIKFPQGEFSPERSDAPVEIIDIMPTILDYLGIPSDPLIQGKSFLSFIAEPPVSETILCRQTHPAGNEIYALRTNRHALICNLKTGKEELYNLSADPFEQRDIADSNKALTAQLRKRLETILQNNKKLASIIKDTRKENALQTEEIEQLKSLGYFAD